MSQQLVNKELRDVIRFAESLGFRVARRAKGKHYKVYLGEHLVVALPSTPGRGRWKANLMAELRRISREGAVSGGRTRTRVQG